MPRDLLNVSFELERIHCHDEGDGIGSAEPYLWTVFFKIDGLDVFLSDGLQLVGSAVIHATPGSHGNLGDTDVDPGDDVTIPSNLGSWQTLLKPIPVPDFVTELAGIEDLPAIAGVICVLMEEDNVTDDGAEAGHHALNAAMQTALDEIIAGLVIGPATTPEEIEAQINAAILQLEEQVSSAVEDAISDQQNVFENIWSWLNSDDTIGFKVFRFSHDDLTSGQVINFSHRWDNHGDWEIFGHANASVACPAESISNTSGLFRRQRLEYNAAGMREFRQKEFARWGEVKSWWEIAVRNAPQLTYAMMQDRKVMDSASVLLREGSELLNSRDKPIPDTLFAHAQRVLTRLAKGRNRRTRIDANRALDVLSLLRGKTPDEALKILSAIKPTRDSVLEQGYERNGQQDGEEKTKRARRKAERV